MNEDVKASLRRVEDTMLNAIAPEFVPEARMALIVYVPGSPGSDVLVLTGSIDDARAAIERAASHPNVREIVG